jgi:hypothetical protein
MRDAILPLPQYVFMMWYLVKSKDKFTLPLYGSEKWKTLTTRGEMYEAFEKKVWIYY